MEPTENDYLVCDSCHKAKPDVKECLDPYALEINNHEVEVQLCDDCYHEYCMDI